MQRTSKRRIARRLKRGGIGEQEMKNQENKTAKAQEPKYNRIRLGKVWWIATINARGMKRSGKREEIEQWMRDNKIMIATIQETRINQNAREARKEYTLYFSGEKGRPEYTAGVAIVINNKYIQHILDIIPITDIIMYIILNAILPITIMSVYTPQAERPEEEKQETYKEIKKIIKNGKTKDRYT